MSAQDELVIHVAAKMTFLNRDVVTYFRGWETESLQRRQLQQQPSNVKTLGSRRICTLDVILKSSVEALCKPKPAA